MHFDTGTSATEKLFRRCNLGRISEMIIRNRLSLYKCPRTVEVIKRNGHQSVIWNSRNETVEVHLETDC